MDWSFDLKKRHAAFNNSSYLPCQYHQDFPLSSFEAAARVYAGVSIQERHDNEGSNLVRRYLILTVLPRVMFPRRSGAAVCSNFAMAGASLDCEGTKKI